MSRLSSYIQRKRPLHTVAFYLLAFLSFAANVVFIYNHYRREQIAEGIPASNDIVTTIDSNTIVFAGNSIVHDFPVSELLPGHRIVNCGIFGNTTTGVLKRIDGMVNRHPKAIFLMEGINDIRVFIPLDSIARTYRKIIEHARGVPLYVYAVLPTAHEKGVLNPAIMNFNDTLKALCMGKGLTYLPINELYLKNGILDSAYTTDGMHINEAAYRKWAEQLKPVLDQIDKTPGP